MKITTIAGGVGGAKLVDGLAQCLREEELSVIVNTGDDFEHLGLNISPDLDTVCYTLADFANEVTGWGRSNESWAILEELDRLGAPTWFRLGDKDIATHLERTRRLREGQSLSAITALFCEKWNIKPTVFPMSDQPVHTVVKTKELGWLSFQEYFVKYQCDPFMLEYRFDGIENAELPALAEERLINSDWVIICPSNPFVSIEPVLKVKRVMEILENKRVLAVSPIINGKALKGPAAKMFTEMGFIPSAYEVLKRYKNILDVFVVNNGDAKEIVFQNHWDIMIEEMDTIMLDRAGRKRLASNVMKIIQRYPGGNA